MLRGEPTEATPPQLSEVPLRVDFTLDEICGDNTGIRRRPVHQRVEGRRLDVVT
jgi:hypothetical protein